VDARPTPVLSTRARTAIGRALLAAAACLFVASGMFSFGRLTHPGVDIRVFHAAGRMWLHGGNPFLDQQLVYAYPPQAAPLFMGLALFPYRAARWVDFLLNAGSLLALFIVYVRWFTEDRSLRDLPLLRACAGAAILLSPMTILSIELGQIAILITGLLAVAWFLLYEKKRDALAGALLGIASIKPQLAVLFLVWLVVDRRWRALAFAALTALVLLLPALAILGGPLETLASWREGMQLYLAAPANQPGSQFVLSLISILSRIHWPLWISTALFALGFALIVRSRARLEPKALLILLPLLEVTLLFGHDADYVGLNLAWLWLIGTFAKTSRTRAAAALALFGLYLLPWAELRHRHGYFLLVPFCLCAVLGAIYLFDLCFNEERAAPPAAAPSPDR